VSTRAVKGMPAAAWRIATALFAAVASTNILTPLLPDVRTEFGISLSTAGLVVGLFGLARLVIDLPAGALLIRMGSVRATLLGGGAVFVASIVGAVTPTIEGLLLSRAVAGAGVAVLAMVALRGMSDVAPAGQRGKVMSLVHVANNSAIAIYPLVGGAVGLLVGWRATFVLTAALALLCVVALVPALRAHAGEDTPSTDAPVTPTRSPWRQIAVVYLGVVANHVHRHGFRNTFIPLFASTTLGLGTGTIAVAIAAMALMGLLVATLGGMASDRFGRRPVIVAGLLGVAAADLAYVGAGDALTFLLLAVVVGAMDFFSSSQTALIADLVAGAPRDRALSGYRFAVDLGAMIGPIALALVFEVFGAVAAIGATSLILATAAVVARLALPVTASGSSRPA
jgi:predicted MFS family arabinose efflux permease